ncbi:MAG: hypothetical protein V4638_10125 [Bacteroidota bacterium]
MLKSILLLLTVCLSRLSYSQNYPEYPHQSANIALVDEFMSEVNLNCPEYNTAEHKASVLERMQRIVIHEVALSMYPECQLLSSASKKNKCNPGMSYLLDSFDPLTFNPLKYFFQYSDTESIYYRVDGKNYIIEIKAKN